MSGTSYNDDTIVTELNDISTAIGTSTNSSAKLIKSEVDRLTERQREILDAKFGQNRIIDLNRDQMKRNAAYTKVGVLTVVCLGIVLLFRLFGSFIPEAILGLIYVLLVSACVFYGLMVYTDVNGRESTNFDRYNIPPPVISLSDDEKNKQKLAAIKSGDLLAASDTKICSGQGCCDYNKAYDSTTNTCSTTCADNGSLPGYYNTITNACATCSTAAPNYIAATKGCGACTGLTPNYNSATKACEVACASGSTWTNNTCA